MQDQELFGVQASLPIKLVGKDKLEKIAEGLKKKGLWVYFGPKFVIVDLRSNTEGDSRRVYNISKEIQDPDLPLMIKCAEGMFGNHQSEAVVVCGIQGAALKPFWTFENYSPLRVPANCHALFSVPEAVATIRARQNGHLLVVKHEIMAVREDKLGGAWINSTVVFDGEFTDIHMALPQYEAAAKAALYKMALKEPFEVCYCSK